MISGLPTIRQVAVQFWDLDTLALSDLQFSAGIKYKNKTLEFLV
jgi:hypothetical protein